MYLRDSIKKQFLINIKLVIIDANKDILPKYLLSKIQNESERTGYKVEQIIDKIKIDEMYASIFCKNPIKQNIIEKLQIKLLQEKNPSIKKLSLRGINAIYLDDKGNLIKGLIKKTNNVTCSIDCYDKLTNTYYYLRYTNEEGGSQDNQFELVKIFIDRCNKNIALISENIALISENKFIIILDGNYYNDNKIKLLNNMILTTKDSENSKIIIKKLDF